MTGRHEPRVFAIVSWGCAATEWLARALDSHPEILALHGGNVEWRRRHGQDVVPTDYLEWLADIGGGYVVVGEVHGIDREAVPAVSAHFGDRFTVAVVVREPLARLRSVLALFREHNYSSARWPGLEYVDDHARRCGIVPGTLTARDRFVLHGVNLLNAITEEQALGPVYRMEDLTTSSRAVTELVGLIGADSIVCSKRWVKSIRRVPASNSHALATRPAAADLAGLTVQGIGLPKLLATIVTDVAWDTYDALGYGPRSGSATLDGGCA